MSKPNFKGLNAISRINKIFVEIDKKSPHHSSHTQNMKNLKPFYLSNA